MEGVCTDFCRKAPCVLATKLYEAVTAALEKFDGVVGRKVMVLASDAGIDIVAETQGSENEEFEKRQEYSKYKKRFSDKSVLRLAQESDVTIYSISLPYTLPKPQKDRASPDPLISKGTAFLERLAEISGGKFFPRNHSLGDALAQTALEIHSQYTVAYAPSNILNDGSFRKIKIEVVDVPGVQVKAREGYITARH